jgi:hypothetical protein
MNKRDCPTLHLDTHESKETACNTIGNAYIWTRKTTQHYTWTQIKVKEWLVVRKAIDVNEHASLSNITLGYKLR